MDAHTHPARWKTLSAFAIIYLVWGSTFLAIRVAVLEVPPFVLAAVRFSLAGLILFIAMLVRGEDSPTRREWLSVSVLSVLIFVLDYGLLFWAEQRVPSGIASVMMSTIPAFMALSEIIFLGTQRLTARLALALLIGSGGVAVLMSRNIALGGAPVDRVGAAALILASVSWSIASAFARKLPLPPSKIMSAAAQMLLGGLLLGLVGLALGEFHNFNPRAVSGVVWLSLVYQIVAGSIIAFTCYVWLIHHESPTKVGTYAYVNPVVAVLIGFFLGGEGLGPRVILGAVFVLISVVVITTTPRRHPEPSVGLSSEEQL